MQYKKSHICLVIFIAVILLNFNPQTIQYNDAAYYVELSNSFIVANHFSIYNFPSTFRGYAFPLIIFALNKLFNNHLNWVAIVLNGGSFAILCGALFPLYVKKISKVDANLSQILIFTLLFYFFWHGYLLYLLTDLTAITIMGLALFLLLLRQPVAYFCAGLCLAMAINFRPMYQVCLLPILTFLIIVTLRSKTPIQIIICDLLFISGMSIVLVPQSMLNFKYYNTLSPLVQTKTLFPGNLYMQQLIEGIKVQKFESFVGPKKEFPSAALYFNHNSGMKIYRQNEAEFRANSSTAGILAMYIKVLLNNKIDMLKILTKHLFNGLDIKYSTPYIKHLHYKFMWLFSLINYILLWSFIVQNFKFWKQRRLQIVGRKRSQEAQLMSTQSIFILANLTIITLFVIPTAVEIRFFLPFYLAVYYCFAVRIQSIIQSFKNKLIICSYVAFVGLCFYLSSYIKYSST